MDPIIDTWKLAIIPYLNIPLLRKRAISFWPYRDGRGWRSWVQDGQGNLIELRIVDLVQGIYISDSPARDDDICIPLLQTIVRRYYCSSTSSAFGAVTRRIHRVLSMAWTLDYLFRTRTDENRHTGAAAATGIIEGFLVQVRALFDDVQRLMAGIWPIAAKENRIRGCNNLPTTYSKMVLHGDNVMPANELARSYGMPVSLAESFVKRASDFAWIRGTRNQVVHATSSVPPTEVVFVTERGYAVEVKRHGLGGIPWDVQHV